MGFGEGRTCTNDVMYNSLFLISNWLYLYTLAAAWLSVADETVIRMGLLLHADGGVFVTVGLILNPVVLSVNKLRWEQLKLSKQVDFIADQCT